MSGPSFYGEVIPLSSRAVDDDEDEEDSQDDIIDLTGEYRNDNGP